MPNITQDYIKSIFDYDEASGKLYWKVNRKGHCVKDKPVGYLGSNGYLRTTVCCKHYFNHRLIWFYHYGYFPESFIDHIDKDRLNNRIENLREVTHQCNLRNSKLNKNNKSGIKGVFLFKKEWIAQIQVNKKTIRLYKGLDREEAIAHRLAGEQAINWSGCDSTSPAYLFMKAYVQ